MDDQGVILDFLVESHENLDQLDRDLLALEKEPAATDKLASVFRTIHTIKGTCGFLGFGKLESVAHVGESLLSRLRDGEMSMTPPIADGLLAMVDAVREMLASIETIGAEGERDDSDLIAALTRLQTGWPGSEELDATDAADSDHSDHAATAPSAPVQAPAVAEVAARPASPPPSSPARQADIASASPADIHDAPAATEHKESAVADSTIRVDVGLLDRLMNQVGELVLARNQIMQFTGSQNDPAFVSTSQRLNLITTELQEGVMKTRMQHIGNIWSKFPRVVRDLSAQCGKRMRLEMEGKETDLDKTIIEAIKDPLTHLVRNSVDHGIEPPEVRIARGKPAEGRLLLRAYHEGGQVNIEISDDGGGLDTAAIKQKAVERGIITADHAARMSEREAGLLIFQPGFSTAAKVTNVSGRGVGMDVVKTNIERIGGTVDLQSKLGHGTTVKIKIPLTLAIIPALIVNSCGDRYAIPQVNLLELVRLDGEQARKGIETIQGAPVYRLRGNLLPLVYLRRELKLEDDRDGERDSDIINMVVLQADDRQFGLIVDGIHDTEEIVVKPLSKQLKGVSAFAGSTIMGDGRVALILDVLGIAQSAGVVSEVRDRTLTDRDGPQQDRAGDRQTMLLVKLGRSRRLGIPLSQVARLEEFPKSQVENAAGLEVVQYRGEILPLVRLARLLDADDADDAEEVDVKVVVHHEGGRSVGLVVEGILDIVETEQTAPRATRHPAIRGSAVIQQRVTDLLDVAAVLGAADIATESESQPQLAGV